MPSRSLDGAMRSIGATECAPSRRAIPLQAADRAAGVALPIATPSPAAPSISTSLMLSPKAATPLLPMERCCASAATAVALLVVGPTTSKAPLR